MVSHLMFWGGKFLMGKKEKESAISAIYLQNILLYLIPNFVCNSVPQVLHITLQCLYFRNGRITATLTLIN